MTETAQASVATPPKAPTVSQSPQIDWGSLANQILIHATPIVEAVVNDGISVALHAIPLGTFFESFVAPKVVDGYIEQGMAALEGLVDGRMIALPGGPLFQYVANLINSQEGPLATLLGPKLDALIHAGLAKIGIQ